MKGICAGSTAQLGKPERSTRMYPLLDLPTRTGFLRWLIATATCCGLLSGTGKAELKPETTAAFQKYVSQLEPRMDHQNHSGNGFLWIDQGPSRLRTVQSGGIASERKAARPVPGGMIQHWIGGVFIPGATLERIVRVDQDYADYGKMYSPEISRPKVLSHDENHYVVSYRITKKKVLTAVEDTVHAIDYTYLQPDRLSVWSRSQSVNQVENAGTSSERVLAVGEGTGFLWAMNSYWRVQQRDGGVYVECEAVTLSRDVPFGMGAMINPILESFAEESLKKTLEAKRNAVKSLR
jgi:hypothetical protein